MNADRIILVGRDRWRKRMNSSGGLSQAEDDSVNAGFTVALAKRTDRYSSCTPYLRKISSLVMTSGTPLGLVTLLPVRISTS